VLSIAGMISVIAAAAAAVAAAAAAAVAGPVLACLLLAGLHCWPSSTYKHHTKK
jgi:hypothetical protein